VVVLCHGEKGTREGVAAPGGLDESIQQTGVVQFKLCWAKTECLTEKKLSVNFCVIRERMIARGGGLSTSNKGAITRLQAQEGTRVAREFGGLRHHSVDSRGKNAMPVQGERTGHKKRWPSR